LVEPLADAVALEVGSTITFAANKVAPLIGL